MNGFIASIDMDVVGVMAEYVNGNDRTILVILAKYCKRFPDDGSSVIRNMFL
jgi:hypothetical protein